MGNEAIDKTPVDDILEELAPHMEDRQITERDVIDEDERKADSRQRRNHKEMTLRMRREYLNRAFNFIKVFVFFVLAITILSRCLLDLSDAIVIALLTTTTANVLGILVIAFLWLFDNPRH